MPNFQEVIVRFMFFCYFFSKKSKADNQKSESLFASNYVIISKNHVKNNLSL